MSKTIRSFTVLLAVILLLSSTACASGNVSTQTGLLTKESSEIESALQLTPVPTASEAVISTSIPISTTSMDAATASPEPSPTPVPIYIPTEEEQKLINKEALLMFSRISVNFTDVSKYEFNTRGDQNDDNTINMVNCLRGNFIGFNEPLSNYYSLSVEQKKDIQTSIINELRGFCNNMNYNLYLKGVCFLDGAQEKFYNPEVYKIFAVLECVSKRIIKRNVENIYRGARNGNCNSTL